MEILRLYRWPALSEAKKNQLLLRLIERVSPDILDIDAEYCFNIGLSEPLTEWEQSVVLWLLRETFEPENLKDTPFLSGNVLEIGPRLNFQTAWSTNAVSIFRACGIKKITRIERSRRYKVNGTLSSEKEAMLIKEIHDRMTECLYPEGIKTFEHGIVPEGFFYVPLIEQGRSALERLNLQLGLGLDDWDIDYYYNLFVNDLKRNPTNVECFDLGQSNSEHSRHWFFKGRLIIDGKEMPHSLMDIVKTPYRLNPSNSVIAFKDNSSAIRGYRIRTIMPETSGMASRFKEKEKEYHITFTAETHNFPSGVAPFPGAETGTGGRIRDTHATGRGSLVVAGTAAYCVGNLYIPNYELPWEDKSFIYPTNLATPLEIVIEASNGASDYGNKFGEPVIQGFVRSFGLLMPSGERREWIKPIMFTGGVGQIDSAHIEKGSPEKGMLVVKVGGPAYRIGMGGGAASSMIQGENVEELDFNAVQRGDAEMEQKLNRVIRACVEMAQENPIVSIHDQGAGGNCNVIKEIIYPEGAKIDIRKIQLGDETLSVLEIWGAEYQEQDALLIRAEHRELFESICEREKVPCSFIGEITGDGYIVLYDSLDGSNPVNLELAKVLGEMPRKTFQIERKPKVLSPPALPKDITIRDALERVLRLISVGSKRFLTNKVDRSVTGLIARQQCAGALQLTVSDVSIIAQSHFSLTGAAISIGEQPIKGLIEPKAMARMAVTEALTNIVWAKISSLTDIKCSANWMWAAKLSGEGALIYDAAVAMSEFMSSVRIAVDGGKDSLSMAAIVRQTGEVVKAPGSLVISAYAPVPDITKVITPDIKRAGSGLLYIDLGGGNYRLGGSALLHCYGQVGDAPPDIEPEPLIRAFNSVQELISNDLILSGHDISDGGLVTSLLEMAFAGDCGLNINIQSKKDALSTLFAEEAGLLIEYDLKDEASVFGILSKNGVGFKQIGKTAGDKLISISLNGDLVLKEEMPILRQLWEETSYRLERLQMNPECADEERKSIFNMKPPRYVVSFKTEQTPKELLKSRPKVAIIREEGSNGDREMASAFYQAGFDVWDITMPDIISGRATLRDVKGVAFVGGFSYADVLDSAKGWAGGIRFNKIANDEFERFYERPDTFSLGVCNGCQLMALLGWVPWQGIEDSRQPRFIQNRSGRFESRFSAVRILPSPSIMLKGMEGSVLGVWVAHGEGRAYFPDKKILRDIIDRGLAPIRYVDDNGEPTERYPFNPNGSPIGITALCSPDGRHLALMPHPERTFLKWQWAWMPEEMKTALKTSPWLKIFQNARLWCRQF